MRDWQREVGRLLESSKLSSVEREEVSHELAGHLEDLCDAACSKGHDEDVATQRAAAELYEDPRLGTKLRRAREENKMNLNDRVKRLWLPGLSMLLASAASLAIFQIAGLRPYFTTLWVHGGPADPHAIYWPLMIYYPWLCLLPFLGAAGTYWSRRAGGSRAVQAAAGFFSVFVFVAIFLTVLVVSFVVGGITGEAPVTETLLPQVMGAVLSWVAVPGAALLLGVLPFLRGISATHYNTAARS